MILPSRRFLLRALVLAALAGVVQATAAGYVAPFSLSKLVIAGTGGRHAFVVEMAETPAQRELGLMNRPSLAPDRGMLFDFGEVRPVGMWMKNTLIPLDMLFIAADGRIVNIAERTKPQSLETLRSAGPVLAVLEVAGGTAQRLGIRPGDQVFHPIFGNAAAE